MRRETTALALVAGLLVASAPVVAAEVVAGPPSGQPVTISQDFDEHYRKDAAPGTGSVTVSQTGDLVRQRVKVSWDGFRPTDSSGRYPVVVLQCWGEASEVTQQRCWGAGRTMEHATFADATAWDRVAYGDAGADDRNLVSALSFTARDGQRYSWNQVEVDAQGRPIAWPDGSVKAGPPPDLSPDTYNYVLPPVMQGTTRADGTGSTDIELLPGDQLPSLGCSDAGTCSLVVVPVGDPHCRPVEEIPWSTVRRSCTGTASGARDSNTWKSPTNWARRFSFPLSFRKSAQVCELDGKPETRTVGSPFLGQLMSSWRPRFCLDEGLFRLGYTSLGEGEARRQFQSALASGVAPAVLTTRPPEGESPVPVVYAPVATTGFSVGFVVDNGDNTEVTSLNLTPRLLMKMLTQSYTAEAPGIEKHPGIAANPKWWGTDPEFAKANPDLLMHSMNINSSTYPLLVQGDLDLTWALTSYLASDREAVEWLGGKPDEWGMVVNPKFKAQALPYAQVELRDDWRVPADASSYPDQLWFNIAANQVPSVVAAAVALVQVRPTATTTPSQENGKILYKRPERQNAGTRALLAITDLPDVAVFGMRSAALRTPQGEFVAPTTESMSYGLQSTTLDAKTGMLAIDHTKLDSRAYPGTTVVYAGVQTAGMPKDSAEKYAKLLEHAAGDGQRYGTAPGDLPLGYLALSDPLREQTRNAAKAVRDQAGEVPPPPPGVGDNPAGNLLPDQRDPAKSNSGTKNSSNPAANQTSTPPPTTASSGSPEPSARPITSVATRGDSNSVGRWLLPGLLGVGLLAGALAPLVSTFGNADHPLTRRLRKLFRRDAV
ncbi:MULTISPECIES: hypothetical protein [Actinosynnema]|uniref:hypothetical protein n=1 Tax=Actinosynnema TaxID=40566 RepID=UPI0020A3ECFA|nr:hypothetical protein [Actinosynnema pretiosum]MCP2092317.1 hypothetical protein [Actinosynnema pretiosum]